MVEGTVLDLAKQYANIVRNNMTVKSIYLYGSQARGEAHKDSDIDIAVVVDSIPGDYMETVIYLWRLANEVDWRIEPKLLSPEDLRSGFLQTVQLTGVAV